MLIFFFKRVVYSCLFLSMPFCLKAQYQENLRLKYTGLLNYFSENYAKDIDSVNKQRALKGYIGEGNGIPVLLSYDSNKNIIRKVDLKTTIEKLERLLELDSVEKLNYFQKEEYNKFKFAIPFSKKITHLQIDERKNYKILVIGEHNIYFQEIKKINENSGEDSIVGFNIINVKVRYGYYNFYENEKKEENFLESNFIDKSGNVLSEGRRFEKLIGDSLALFSIPTKIKFDNEYWEGFTLKNFEIWEISPYTYKPIKFILKIDNCNPDKVDFVSNSSENHSVDDCIKDVSGFNIFNSRTRVNTWYLKTTTFYKGIGLLNLEGETIAHNVYTDIKPLYTVKNGDANNIFITEIGNKKGAISENGTIIFEPTLEDLDFDDLRYNGMATFIYNDRYGVINNDMKIIVEPEFSRAYLLNEEIALVKKRQLYGNDTWEFLNMRNKIITNYKIQEILSSDLKELVHPNFIFLKTYFTRIGIKVNNNWGYADNKGSIVIQPKYSDILSLNDGLALVSELKKVYVENKNLYVPKGVNYQSKSYFYKATKMLIHKDGSVLFVLPEKLADDIQEVDSKFYDGLMLFKSRYTGKYGFFGMTGRVEIDPYFDSASHFYNGKADVTKFGTSYEIDKKGNRL